MTKDSGNKFIGARIRRVEDLVLVSGKGCYTDDVQLPGMRYMALTRSLHAHAKVGYINTDVARAMPGVDIVLTGADLSESLNLPVPVMAPEMKIPPHPVLARGAVHAVGVPVAAVVAQSRAIAEDAACAIEVEHDPLPVVVNAKDAIKPGAPLAREELDSNVCYRITKQGGDVDKAFEEADHICRMQIASPRQVAVALEPRGIVVKPEPMGDLTVWLSTQSPHRVRADLATALNFPEHRIRVIVPDVGGGFGSKIPLYREYVLACYFALRLGRPVKWIATRSEDFVTTIQGRDQAITSELALKRDGTMLGLKVRVLSNLGAYLCSNTAGPPQRMMEMAPGCYQIQTVRIEVVAVFTNTVSTGPYRGAGRPESVLNIERLVDKAARELGLDPLQIRRKNFIRPGQFPYRTGVGVEYDSGDYEKTLDEALRVSDYEQLLRYRDESRARGEIVGVGVSTFVEPSGGLGFESATVRVERTGVVTVLTGSSSQGQGHATAFAQIVADQMRVPMEQIVVRHGDTWAIQQGVGTFGSRSALLGGGAMVAAIERISSKARRIAAYLMESSDDDVVPVEGGFAVAGVPTQVVTWHQIAAVAHGNLPPGLEPGLQETVFFDPKRDAWGFGAHIAVVKIDRETGKPTVEKLVLIDDCGVVINPMIVEGQIHGGVAQGLAESFREQMLFGDDGEVMTGTLMNYAVPRATDMPSLTLGETVTPNPFHPLGVKGVGEAGTNGAPAAIASAVLDALAPLGIYELDMPYTAPKLWTLIRACTEKTEFKEDP